MTAEQSQLDFATMASPGVEDPDRTPKHRSSASMDLPKDAKAVAMFLENYCQGEKNTKTAKSIGIAVGFTGNDPGRKVRHIIELHLDQFPFIVCGSPGSGFFVTHDPEAMTHYERLLHRNLRAAAAKISAFHRATTKQGFPRTGSGPSVKYSRKEPPNRRNH